jgi:hypothetical protein
MAADDTLDIGQSNAGAFELVGVVQPLKNAKQLIGVLHIEAHAIIADKKDLFAVVPGMAADFDLSA